LFERDAHGAFLKRYTFLEKPRYDLWEGSYIEKIGFRNIKQHKLFHIGVPAGLLFAFIFRDSLALLARTLPPCPFYNNYHICCPSCGNTRSVLSLLHGDIISSIRYNITPVFLLAILLAFYCEAIAQLFGKKIAIVPRKISFLVIAIVGFITYYVIRNFIPGLIL